MLIANIALFKQNTSIPFNNLITSFKPKECNSNILNPEISRFTLYIVIPFFGAKMDNYEREVKLDNIHIKVIDERILNSEIYEGVNVEA